MKDLTTNIRDNLLAALAACQAEGLPFKPTKLELEYMKRAKDWELPTIDRLALSNDATFVTDLTASHSNIPKAHAVDHMEVGVSYIVTRDPYFLTLWSVPNAVYVSGDDVDLDPKTATQYRADREKDDRP